MRCDECGDYSLFLMANARRIVACVNACKGIPTEALEKHPGAVLEIGAANLTADRDKWKSLAVEVMERLTKLEYLTDTEGFGKEIRSKILNGGECD